MKEIELYIKERDDENLTRALDRRCRSLEGMGMSKVDKVSLEDVPSFKVGFDIDRWPGQTSCFCRYCKFRAERPYGSGFTKRIDL